MLFIPQIDISTVTADQIAKCSRFVDLNTHTPYYLVQSEADDLKEYKVACIRKQGRWVYTCTCQAGLHGFTNCKDGYCKHVRWSQAAAEEYKELIKAAAEAQARIDAQRIARAMLLKQLNVSSASENVSNEDLANMIDRNKKPKAMGATIQARPFSIL